MAALEDVYVSAVEAGRAYSPGGPVEGAVTVTLDERDFPLIRHVCRGVETLYTTVSGKQEVHWVCACGLLLAVTPPATDSPASVSPKQTPTPAVDSAHSGEHSTVGGAS